MNTRLVRDVVGVRQKVLASDLTLPPCAPVVETHKQRVESLIFGRFGVVALEERVAVGKFGFPGRLAELIRAQRGPCR